MSTGSARPGGPAAGGRPAATSARISPMPVSPDSASAPSRTSFAPVYAFGLCDAVHISPPSSACEPTRKYSISRADHSGVEHVRALRDHAVAIPAGELGRAQAHVAAEPDPQRARLLPAQAGEHAHEGAPDELGDVAVDLLAVEPADVIGLEDLERDRRGHGRRG